MKYSVLHLGVRSSSVYQEFPCSYEMQKLTSVIAKAYFWVLSWLNVVHILANDF
jgi:hypothetical protein